MCAMAPEPDYWMKRVKWLTQALLLSGTLNVGLFSTFLYLALREKYRPLQIELKSIGSRVERPHIGLQELLIQYKSLSFEELLEGLSSNEHIEAGYSKRDLALAALVAFHHFNLERALGGLHVQKRLISFRNPQTLEKLELTIFPGLADYQYQAIIQYAKTEKWPFNPYGLFLTLKKTQSPYDPSLLEAFSMTPQFHFLSTLFSKAGSPLTKHQMVALLIGGSWEIIQEASEFLKVNHAFDSLRRRQFLIKLLLQRSQFAAALLLQTDFAFVYKQFDDNQMLAFLDLLGVKTPVLFAKALLLCPRSDSIWKRASSILYEQLGEKLPEPYSHPAALNRFIYNNCPPSISFKPPVKIAEDSSPKEALKKQLYCVQSGDTLYKIARNHKTSVQALQAINHMENDRLYPGQEIALP